ncbi:MAG TPA: ATP-dependent DNA helicase RecG [Candidatus Syntrophosphaera sp.]|jgi:ATP-dependent DNA helicase RecG|nr:ATP-dependent DNA helicase RecG [Candidatus Syntrophosphaera sp.]HOH48016.1 ATP-dependent DNA helicase RecG [Candidatus Syntrophosphaera sp.]HPW38269.1 ATP-dependent DNA helicase RecG [Candidatus Syntrophosphaera sp.]HQC46974.1 ATP-dependent DNA helicase RecG [Candidatus Syntrophosphaera sp.]
MEKAEFVKDTRTPVKFLKGVGEVRSRQLAKLGINTVLDLMEHFPRAYIARKLNPSLRELKPGDNIALTAMISWVDERRTRKGKNLLEVGISDGRAAIVCSWFSYPKSFPGLFKPGAMLWVAGNLTEYNGQLQLMHPEVEFVDDSEELDFWKKREFLPVYRLSGDLTQKFLRRIVYSAFELFTSQIEENLPEELIAKRGFLPRKVALQKMHFSLHPEELDKVRKRFVYEEFFYSQLLWARHKRFHAQDVKGIRFENRRDLTSRLYRELPFKLTQAQKRVINEIFGDMCSDRQMSRLLQGDVGSGKTIVTLFAMLLAVENGFQAALMAPTEILADQHYGNITRLLKDFPLNIVLLKGGSYKGKAQTKNAISTGEANLIIGTHALLQSDISFEKLGFVAVDEQHRFGVQQRATLARKDKHPDLLYLSATPIPRSLSLTVYGDLEVSIINELPPDRIPVKTLVRSNQKIDLVYREVAKELAAGSQVYVVCPLIEESDKMDLLDAQRMHNHLSTNIFPQYSCVLLHGKMPSREKDTIMLRFKAGEIRILVSTTVIEVGLDIPNASVMIVEHAERFGLAQLHQLRGRVGRGGQQAWCYLIEHFPLSSVARERLDTMAKTTDGFLIAEKDLHLRGPGEFFGTEQSGLPQFTFANLVADQPVLKEAREDAFSIIAEDLFLEQEKNALIKKFYTLQFADKEMLILY